jgi:hypothetical protein
MFSAKTKLRMSLLGLFILCAVGACFVVFGQWSAGLWGLWFGAFDGIILGYAAANVAQKQVISKNYRPELAGQGKDNDELQGVLG